jgi:hypothetical protein
MWRRLQLANKLRSLSSRYADILLTVPAVERALKNTNAVLTAEVRRSLIEALLDEFSLPGLKVDGEPNERGLRIEELIDELGDDSVWEVDPGKSET